MPRFKRIAAREEWCHVCGERSTGLFVEIRHLENAEHPAGADNKMQIFRICGDCVETVAEMLR